MRAGAKRSSWSWLVPEVVQTSEMDCGPAVLKSLLEGFGIPIDYGRLREVCQTDVDGTSIDVLESVACRLGLAAEQVMVPIDHLLFEEAGALPSILVMRLPNGFTHFVLAWRRHGPLVQVMDPAEGRRWLSGRRLIDEAYAHSSTFPADAWHAWAVSDEFLHPLGARLRALGVGRSAAALINEAAADPDWQRLATLDATTRLVEALVRARGVHRGREAGRLVRSLLARSESGERDAIPDRFRAILPAAPGPAGEACVSVRGAVLVRVRPSSTAGWKPVDRAAIGPELASALAAPATRRLRPWVFVTQGSGPLALAGLLVALVLGLALIAGGTVFEALLFRSALGVGRDLQLVQQRLAASAAMTGVVGLLLLAEFGVANGLLWLGRKLEISFRAAFSARIPRLADRYFHSRPISDMTDRSHKIHQLRVFPTLVGQAVRAALSLAATGFALAWIDPRIAPVAALAAGLAVAVPLGCNLWLQALDLRVRTHAGALGRFYLDALLGLVAIRAHAAEGAVRREHEGLLVEWARASRRFVRGALASEALQSALGFGFAAALILLDAGRAAEAGGTLLLAYWALNVPLLGEEMALLVRQYPLHRNTMLRLLEPLGAAEEQPERDPKSAPEHSSGDAAVGGVTIEFESVGVRAGGHTILRDVTLKIDAGSHVAVVGPSGAGKSTLVGVLLGWHQPAAGRVLVDGARLDATRLDGLRAQTAWVDPEIQIWNRSLLDNLRYGTRRDEPLRLSETVPGVDLFRVLGRLPEGLQTVLGEGGGLLSGGEGQRVRLGRAWMRSRPRLVVLDEPFRGLDRDDRSRLLGQARERFRGVTLLCVTHDVAETTSFDRVLVVEDGQVVEDGAPAHLAFDAASRYHTLLAAEAVVREQLWSGPAWSRLFVEEGRIVCEGKRT